MAEWKNEVLNWAEEHSDGQRELKVWRELITEYLEEEYLKEDGMSDEEFKQFLNRIESDRIEVNYDTGNSAYWGYEAETEIKLYGEKIGNIHIKDCTPEDYSVPLGQGNVDFDLSFQKFKEINYQGDFILQTVRTNNDIKSAKEFRAFTLSYISKYLV